MILLKEYLNFKEVSQQKDNNIHIAENAISSIQKIPKESVMVDIEGLHVGPTRNFTRYTEQSLMNSVPTWTQPYLKPIIMHHNEEDGKTIGRVLHAEYKDIDTLSGTGALLFTANIPDKEGKEQVEDGRLMTVSVGIVGRDVRCSICGHQIAEEGPCEYHLKGHEYEGQVCYWDIYEIEGKEISYVVVPSDVYARNIRVYKPDENINGQSYLRENFRNEVNVMGENEKKPQEMKKEELVNTYQSLQESHGTLQEELDSLKKEKETLQSQVQEANQKIESLNQTITEQKNEDSKEEKSQEDLSKEIEDLKEQLASKESELKEQKELREAAESSAEEARQEARKNLVEQYNLLRKVTNKSEVDEEKIKERNEESIKGAIVDLREELETNSFGDLAGSVSDPSLNVEESETEKKNKKPEVNLQEELQNIFNGVVGTHII